VGHVRHAAVQEVTVVRDEQQRAAVLGEPPLEPHDRIEVEVVGRLVEQQQVGAAQQCTAEIEAHAPAPREGGDRALEVAGREPQSREHGCRPCARDITVDALEPCVKFRKRMPVMRVVGAGNGRLDRAQFRVAVQHEFDRRLLESRGFLADRGDAPVRRHLAVAGLGVQFAEQQCKEARLAAAIRANEPDTPARMQLQVGFLDEGAGAAGERELP
jgi:hypothetical protein